MWINLQTCIDTLHSLRICEQRNIDVHLRLDDLVRMRELRVLFIYGVKSIHVHSWRKPAAPIDANQQLPLADLEFHAPVVAESASALTEWVITYFDGILFFFFSFIALYPHLEALEIICWPGSAVPMSLDLVAALRHNDSLQSMRIFGISLTGRGDAAGSELRFLRHLRVCEVWNEEHTVLLACILRHLQTNEGRMPNLKRLALEQTNLALVAGVAALPRFILLFSDASSVRCLTRCSRWHCTVAGRSWANARSSDHRVNCARWPTRSRRRASAEVNVEG